ncbi:hypothetical protein DEO72_LG2g4065 [Vigna unguiculata]|uniref:Uncharacterized protein n=1 Tax=Vigna unguiculata TaxID=3917 RepID=A0A4D6L5E0_VIGUN|nr:hypothetical protein DEO72_LG2g4065 [Vigna unguiculata]
MAIKQLANKTMSDADTTSSDVNENLSNVVNTNPSSSMNVNLNNDVNANYENQAVTTTELFI